MSSAYRMRLEEGESGMSDKLLMYKIKRRGPNIEPWGTPEKACDLCEEEPLRTTC